MTRSKNASNRNTSSSAVILQSGEETIMNYLLLPLKIGSTSIVMPCNILRKWQNKT